MRTTSVDVYVATMGAQIKRVELELDDGDPISGQIRLWPAPPQPFRGRIELASTLERLRRGLKPDDTAHDETEER